MAETTSVWGDNGSLTIIQDTDMGVIQIKKNKVLLASLKIQ
jgi:hypothetical protein